MKQPRLEEVLVYQPKEKRKIVEKLGLSGDQKKYIKRMYRAYQVEVLGMPDDGIVRCMCPEHNGVCGRGIEKWEKHNPNSIEQHHLIPKRYMAAVLGENPDVPWNIVPLCAYHHVGTGYKGDILTAPVVHRDIIWASREYAFDNTAFSQVFERRSMLVDEGQIYWNDDYDKFFVDIARQAYAYYKEVCPDDLYRFREWVNHPTVKCVA